jgi:hypothetical protein
MLGRNVLSLGAFKVEALFLARGEKCVEVLGDRAIAVVLVSGQARCNGQTLQRWNHMPVTRSCCLEAVDNCVVARFAIEGQGALHLGHTP